MIRPEVASGLHRWREVLICLAIALFGLWLATRGGYLLLVLGALVGAAGLGLAYDAVQRLRFRRPAEGPGVVELDEGEIRWFGPGVGGAVAVHELAQVGLINVQGLRVWRLVQENGGLLLVPIDAKGAELLFDALTALPGLDAQRLIRALDQPFDSPILWSRRSVQTLQS